jgi:hypothetical protein
MISLINMERLMMVSVTRLTRPSTSLILSEVVNKLMITCEQFDHILILIF